MKSNKYFALWYACAFVIALTTGSVANALAVPFASSALHTGNVQVSCPHLVKGVTYYENQNITAAGHNWTLQLPPGGRSFVPGQNIDWQAGEPDTQYQAFPSSDQVDCAYYYNDSSNTMMFDLVLEYQDLASTRCTSLSRHDSQYMDVCSNNSFTVSFY